MGRGEDDRSDIGVDNTKSRLDVFRLENGAALSFDTAAGGFRAFARWLGKGLVPRVVFKPTAAWQGVFTCPRRGPYHKAFEVSA